MKPEAEVESAPEGPVLVEEVAKVLLLPERLIYFSNDKWLIVPQPPARRIVLTNRLSSFNGPASPVAV